MSERNLTRDVEVGLLDRLVPAGGKRLGLVIGIGEPRNPNLALRCARADAEAVHRLMTDPECGMFKPENVRLLLDGEATREQVWRALADLRRSAGQNDTVWVYYAGHTAFEGQDLYWVTADADIDDLFGTGLNRADVVRALDGVGARRLLLLLDCCYAAASALQRNPTRAQVNAEELVAGYRGEGRVTLCSSDGREKSVELADVGHGAFTFFLERGLRGEADADGDGVVTADELWAFLRGKVEDASRRAGNPQRPVMDGQMTHDFALTLNPVGVGRKKRIAEAIEARVGLGGERLSTDEAEFCIDILRRGAKTPEEIAVAAEFDALAEGRIQPGTFKNLVALGRKARAAAAAERAASSSASVPPPAPPHKPALAPPERAQVFPCSRCGASVSRMHNFCPNCGQELRPAERCRRCGQFLDPDTACCQRCGARKGEIR